MNVVGCSELCIEFPDRVDLLDALADIDTEQQSGQHCGSGDEDILSNLLRESDDIDVERDCINSTDLSSSLDEAAPFTCTSFDIQSLRPCMVKMEAVKNLSSDRSAKRRAQLANSPVAYVIERRSR